MPTRMPQLSIIMPCYNEISTLAPILRKVGLTLPQVHKEIVIVDDKSSDGSSRFIAEIAALNSTDLADFLLVGSDTPESGFLIPQLKALFHETNGGKGTAIRTGLAHVSGEVIVIQDADLEYEPSDWIEMYALIADDRADVVYGSRFYGRPHRSLYYHHYFGNRLISRSFNILYNQILTDIETCYKMFRRETIEGIEFKSKDFGIEIELSAAIVLARKWRIYEMGIRYFGRTFDEGKKINWRDGIKALWYLIAFRFRDYKVQSVAAPAEPELAIQERRSLYLKSQKSSNSPASSNLAQGRDKRGADAERVDAIEDTRQGH